MEKRAQGRQQEKQSWDVDSGEEFRIRTLKENPKETWMSPLRPGLARMLRSPSQHTLLRFYQTEGSFIRPKNIWTLSSVLMVTTCRPLGIQGVWVT